MQNSSIQDSSNNSSSALPLSAIGILAVIGAALAAISLYQHTAQSHSFDVSVPLCTLNDALNCKKVNASPYSNFLGLPVSAWGLGFFLIQLALSTSAQSSGNIGSGAHTARNLLVGTGALGVLFCLYLALVSTFLIGAWCPLCLGVYLITLLSFGLSITANRPATIGTGIKESWAAVRRLLPGSKPIGSGYRLGILVFLFIGAICVMAPGFMLVNLIAPSAESKQRAEAEGSAVANWRSEQNVATDLITSDGEMKDFGYGESGAPVQIVEFSDYQCPFCRRLAGELEQVMEQFSGKIQVTVRNFPLDATCNPAMPESAHPLSCAAATFARCAGEQGQFKAASTWLNETPELEEHSTTLEAFEGMIAANSLRLDTAALAECRAASRTSSKISADIKQAIELGIQGTPLVYINGKRLDYPTKETIIPIVREIIGSK